MEEEDNVIVVAISKIFSTGINIKNLHYILFGSGGKAKIKTIQSIGRGIRKAQDKDFVQIWDITSTCKFAKRHLTKRKAFYREANYPFTVEKAEWQD